MSLLLKIVATKSRHVLFSQNIWLLVRQSTHPVRFQRSEDQFGLGRETGNRLALGNGLHGFSKLSDLLGIKANFFGLGTNHTILDSPLPVNQHIQ